MRTGLVLGGGGARGAYEAGVVAYLRDELGPRLGRNLPIDILCGTSVGAINACYLASTAERPEEQGRTMVDHWTSVKLEEVLHFEALDVVRLIRESFGKPRRSVVKHGGLVDLSGLAKVLLRAVHWRSIGRALRSGALHSLAVSATHVATGRTEVFMHCASDRLPLWTRDPNLRCVQARIGPRHALASAAIPLLFPAVRIGGDLYVDGGVRLNVPISPALRLGAERVILISLKHIPSAPAPLADGGEEVGATFPFLFGKTLNALLLDRTDQDVGRMRLINSMLQAGTEAYGPGFADVLNKAILPHREQPVRYVRNILVRPSRDIARMAAEHARSPAFANRAKGWAGALVRRLVEREGPDSDDLVSYLLFDAEFARALIDLGRSDARAMEAEWARFWSDLPENVAEAENIGAA
jgi:NTE family protein